MSSAKDYRRLVEGRLRVLGFELQGQGRHRKWRHPQGLVMTTSVSPSDRRALLNALARLRRIERRLGGEQ